MEPKYLVFKNDAGAPGELVDDAVVIRRQDIFAPPALDAYANALQTAIEVLTNSSAPSGRTAQLQDIADYFSDQAAKSWSEQRRLPD